MQKVTEILEKHAQWIAIGLGGLWVLYVAYAYWLSAPASIDIGGTVYTPANVDGYVAEQKKTLESRLRNVGKPAWPQVKDTLDKFVASFQPMPAKPLETASAVVQSLPTMTQLQSAADVGPAMAKVTKLPEPVPTTLIRAISGRSQVTLPEQEAPAMPNAVPGRPLPVRTIPGRNPVMPARLDVQQVDKVWVRVFYEFDEVAFRAACLNANVPEDFAAVTYIDVELQREELDANGNPTGKIVTVKPPAIPQNLPPATADRKKDVIEFLSWVEQAQTAIIKPAFYTIHGGDPWDKPEGVDPLVAPELDPQVMQPTVTVESIYQEYKAFQTDAERAKFIRGLVGRLTPEQLRAFHAYRIEKEREERLQNQPQPQPRTPGRTGNVRGGNYDAQDPGVLQGLYAQAGSAADDLRQHPRGGAGARPAMPPGYQSTAPRRPTYNPQPQPYYSGREARQPVIGPDGVPVLPATDGWAHDDTAEPGKSYRYRVRVVVKNPVYSMKILVADPKLSEVLDLPQGWSEWSPAVVIPKTMKFQFAGTGAKDGGQAKFRVWKWQQGAMMGPREFSVSPGDVIGNLDKLDNMDFTTGWIVVDVRKVGSDWQAILVNDNNSTVVRSLTADTKPDNPEFKGLPMAPAEVPGVPGGVPGRPDDRMMVPGGGAGGVGFNR